jgi:hypothetical protein
LVNLSVILISFFARSGWVARIVDAASAGAGEDEAAATGGWTGADDGAISAGLATGAGAALEIGVVASGRTIDGVGTRGLATITGRTGKAAATGIEISGLASEVTDCPLTSSPSFTVRVAETDGLSRWIGTEGLLAFGFFSLIAINSSYVALHNSRE